jgi:hypothetical protein
LGFPKINRSDTKRKIVTQKKTRLESSHLPSTTNQIGEELEVRPVATAGAGGEPTLAGHEAVAQLALVFLEASRVRAAEPSIDSNGKKFRQSTTVQADGCHSIPVQVQVYALVWKNSTNSGWRAAKCERHPE